MQRYIYGIDFGTTNSSLSIMDTEENKIVKTFSDASLLFFPQLKHPRQPLKHFVGRAAIDQYIKSNMNGRFMKSIKRVLPRTAFTSTMVYNRRFKAPDLVALVVQHLKQQADDYLGQSVKNVVWGRPVVFDENPEKDALAQKRLLKAAQIVGFEKIYFQPEPIAAAFTYERSIKTKQTILVADLGGGTSDFTLVTLDPEKIKTQNRKLEVALKDGVYVGGDSFDSDLMWEKGTEYFGRGLTYWDYDTKVAVPNSFFFNICSWEKMNFFNNLKIKNAIDKYHYLTNRSIEFERFKTLTSDMEL